MAAYLGIKPNTVYHYARRGMIPGVVRILGRTIRFLPEDVIAWVKKSTEEGGGKK